jgi:hypothetical protein
LVEISGDTLERGEIEFIEFVGFVEFGETGDWWRHDRDS